MALEKGYAINLSGGYHHCSSTLASGFCFIPDITLAIFHLRKFFGLKKIMIVDLDAHQGNGHERDFLNDQDVFIIDFYNPYIFPADQFAKPGISASFYVTSSVSDEIYLKAMDEIIPQAILKFEPEFIVYNAGTDILDGDPLGQCSISQNGIVNRDDLMFGYAFDKKIPILMVLSGGYLRENAACISGSINNIFTKYELPF